MDDIVNKIFRRIKSAFFSFRFRKCFNIIGRGVRIYSPLKIQGKNSINIGNNVKLSEGLWLASISQNGSVPILTIGENSMIGHYNHIYCTSKITIENDVLTADKVYISDNSHSYVDVDLPIWQQPIKQLENVVIGEGCWIGENVCIIGASVGKHSVIGANSVVTKNIPDYCIAVGAPAKVIKRYDFDSGKWISVHESLNKDC